MLLLSPRYLSQGITFTMWPLLCFMPEKRDVALIANSEKEKYVCSTLSCAPPVSRLLKGVVQHYWPISYQSIPSLQSSSTQSNNFKTLIAANHSAEGNKS